MAGIDFIKGFMITEKIAKKKPKNQAMMRKYEIKEIKEADHCPYCGSTYIQKTNKGRYKSHWVHAVVDDCFAYCHLLRWEYRCYDCPDYTVFFNTDLPEAYANTDEFSRNFVKKALEYWLSDKDKPKKEKLTLRKVARQIGFNYSSITKWNKLLSEEFSASTVVPSLWGDVILSSFTDRDGIRRGFICQCTQDGLVLRDFLDEYSVEFIRSYFLRVPERERSLLYETQNVYYSYEPGLGDCLAEFFKYARICMNHNSLSNQVARHLPSLDDAHANELRIKLAAALFGIKDNYALSLVPGKVKESLLMLPEAERADFLELMKEKPSRYLMNTFHIDTSRFDTKKYREEIKEMTGKNFSYYTIKVKFLFDNDEFKDDYRRALEKTMDTFGRIFCLITAESIQKSALYEKRGYESDFMTICSQY